MRFMHMNAGMLVSLRWGKDVFGELSSDVPRRVECNPEVFEGLVSLGSLGYSYEVLLDK